MWVLLFQSPDVLNIFYVELRVIRLCVVYNVYITCLIAFIVLVEFLEQFSSGSLTRDHIIKNVTIITGDKKLVKDVGSRMLIRYIEAYRRPVSTILYLYFYMYVNLPIVSSYL